MTFAHLKFIVVVLVAITFAACGKTVTNNVPGPTTSTTQAPSPTAQSDSGGVINGGGGKGVRCLKNGKTTVEILDLYEAKSLYGLTVMDFGSEEEPAKEKMALIFAHHFWNPFTIPMEKFAKMVKQRYIQQFLDQIRFVDAGKKLRLTNDSYEPTLETGCESVQIATYYDESVLLVDKELWSQLDWTNKVGLIMHEAMYFFVRQSGTKNSMGIRKLVGMMLSTKQPRPLADGVPPDRKNFMECRITANGFSKGAFFMYRQERPDGNKGLEIVFNNLTHNVSFFRTSAFLENLSFFQLQFPKYAKSFQAELLKDSYPTRDQIGLTFLGIVDGQLKAELRILMGAGSSLGEALDVSCDVPAKFDDLESQSTEPGEFSQKHGDGSIDILKVKNNGSLTIALTRQVGGPGGFSATGAVPYPTSCRYKQTGVIQSQDQHKIQYLVVMAEVGDLEGLTETEHCKDYVDAVNRKAAEGYLRYTITKSEYTKTK